MSQKAKITIVGSGYVGMSLAILLAQENIVKILDIDSSRVKKINSKESTVDDKDINNFIHDNNLEFSGTLDKEIAYKDADFIIIATPTNFDTDLNKFDTNSVDSVISDIFDFNQKALIVIKSTVPIGYTKLKQDHFSSDRIIFSPEFLREGQALHDNLYPSRIIIGSKTNLAEDFMRILCSAAKKKDVHKLFMESTEAESVKLFANSYLAMRVSFFNELDSFALKNNLNPENIINGLSYDKRIGYGYNNPSFGYGGYCLPKDTKQLLHHFKDTPQDLISGIVNSNATRKDFLVDSIISSNPKVVGIFRLIMKSGSENFRSSSIQGLIKRLIKRNIEIIIYEPLLETDNFEEIKVIKDFKNFIERSDIILANRVSEDLYPYNKKVFSRDIFKKD